MKTRNFSFYSKTGVIGVFKAAIIAILSVAFVAILMTLVSTMAYSSGSSNVSIRSIVHHDNCASMMSDEQFDLKLAEISHRFYEETKVNLSRELLDQYCVSSKQVRDLMKLFAYDQTRINFAAYAINKVLDPENFEVCKEAFMLGANKTSIDELIREHAMVGK